MADGEEAAKKILEAGQDGQHRRLPGYQMNAWNRVVQTIAASGKPTLYADFQYGGSGGFLGLHGRVSCAAKRPTSDSWRHRRMEDLVAAVRCFRVGQERRIDGGLRGGDGQGPRQSTPSQGDMTCKPDKVADLKPKECLARMKESKILTVEKGWSDIDAAV